MLFLVVGVLDEVCETLDMTKGEDGLMRKYELEINLYQTAPGIIKANKSIMDKIFKRLSSVKCSK